MRSRLLPILALVMLAALPAAAHTRTRSDPNGVLQPHLSSDVEIEPEIALPPIIAGAPDTLPVFTRSRKLASGFFALAAQPNIQETLDLGQESRLGDDYMHARYYNPNLGRFLSVDPGNDWDPKQPQSWNLYSYTANNPLLRVDPDGRAAIDPNRLFLQYSRTLQHLQSATQHVRNALVVRPDVGVGRGLKVKLGPTEVGGYVNLKPQLNLSSVRESSVSAEVFAQAGAFKGGFEVKVQGPEGSVSTERVLGVKDAEVQGTELTVSLASVVEVGVDYGEVASALDETLKAFTWGVVESEIPTKEERDPWEYKRYDQSR